MYKFIIAILRECLYNKIECNSFVTFLSRTFGRKENLKKILMRSAMPFGEEKIVPEVLIQNLVGDNTGNLLFQNSVARLILTEDTEITTIKTITEYSDEEVDYFNSEYDMFIIPLANAFRLSFLKELKRITHLIERLKMPCIVIGVGIQRNLDATKWHYSFDEDAKAFTRAVLEKSAIMGIRGEITAQYMKGLGFEEDKHFSVIGCPSLYTYGDSLPVPKMTNLTPKSNVTVNFKAMLERNVYRFLRSQAEQFDKFTFVTQAVPEIGAMYIGNPYTQSDIEKGIPEDYPIYFKSELMVQDKMVGVLDDYTWVEYLKQSDFNFGSRIHGNIASILAGTPCYIFASDQRVQELAEYHNIPYMPQDKITESTNIFDLYEKTDYSCLMRGHKDRVSKYIDFLDQNKVEHLDRDIVNQVGATPFDKMQASRKHIEVLHPFPVVSYDEQQERIQEYIEYVKYFMQGKVDKVRSNYSEYRKQSNAKIKEYQTEQKKLKKELALIKSSHFYKMKIKYDAIKSKFK